MPSLAALTVLAHQGGWDEILMVLTPIAVFALLLKTANGRARRRAAEQAADPAADQADPAGQDRDVGSAGDPLNPA